MDKSRYDDRSSPWRKRTGARRSLVRRWAGVPMRLVLVTVAAASALATQFVMH
ncbi:thermonuclease family protein, partial [Mesorhizobium sp. M2A.F.Ca.ET.029.05.1.1]